VNVTCFFYLTFMVFNIRIFFRSISAGLRVGHIFVSTLTTTEKTVRRRTRGVDRRRYLWGTHKPCGKLYLRSPRNVY